MYNVDEIKDIVDYAVSFNPNLQSSFGVVNAQTNVDGSISVTVNNTLVLRAKSKKSNQLFYLKPQAKNSFEALGITLLPNKNSNWICFSSSVFDPLNGMKEQLRASLFSYIYNMLKSNKFGCCSKYLECSNEKMCLHADLAYSMGCTYRHNLEAGRIFYGVNKNT